MEIAVEEEIVTCVCGKKITVIWTSCGYINCAHCGMLLKVGACD